jgi:hypothetical protein
MDDGAFVTILAVVCIGLGWALLYAHANYVHRERMERLEEKQWRAFWGEEVD